mmetsp:Transcript_39710/g.55135  ORF Transcript_39710/g.55135 Transcript_39710/m.55135 type:complete len:362 (-) Transcript_39710:148-1233(-)|eukprot:CAMPEP_0196589356 /NCGR_PEP_ID=MMETSP1081-20130531/63319_1 /TAXON_ID=36882 /ORGANISM="Pyramimonas amylifera, Strain CCMP720" /LENGTH=361 /DNA_ID=CAMNT_0041912131 /DNA_START=149 /DNA_END=1234 /DNA_ORIENTATION=-
MKDEQKSEGSDSDFKTARVDVVILPDDANPAGNCHGGTILKLVEMVGWIAATRFVNRSDSEDKSTTNGVMLLTARLERMSFLAPLYVGEVASLSAKILFCSGRSVEVMVTVEAEDVLHAKRRTTNTAVIFFIPLKDPSRGEIELPSIVAANPEEEELVLQGQARHVARRAARQTEADLPEEEEPGLEMDEGVDIPPNEGSKSPGESRSVLSQLMLPSDCSPGTAHMVRGGVLLKLMDNAAGVAAFKHCMSNVVTASVDSITFLEPLHNGGLAVIESQVVFTGTKSLEVFLQVWGEELDPTLNKFGRKLLTTGTFTFVSLDAKWKPQKVPQLRPETKEELKLFLKAKAKYEANKLRRVSLTK